MLGIIARWLDGTRWRQTVRSAWQSLDVASETLTFGLAVAGATTGLASAATQMYGAVVDRPSLATNFGITTRQGDRPTIYIEVTNLGRRPTTVREVGFYGGRRQIDVIRSKETEAWARGTAEITFHEGPIFLDAGKSQRIELVPNIDSFGIHADYPFRAYAVDLRGRRIWGEAAPVVRMLFGPQPPLTPSDPKELRELFEPPRPDLRPAKVVAGWKLWKRRELRAPEAWRSPLSAQADVC